MKTIEITINPQGQVRLQTKGFAGTACQQASKFLEEALGVNQGDSKTAEFYQPAQAQQQAKTTS